MAPNHPAPIVDTSDRLRRLKRYLVLRENGLLFHEAVRGAGLLPDDIHKARNESPQFKDAERWAMSAAHEKVERVLVDAAREGEAWAVKDYLKANLPEVYGDKAVVSHVHSVDVNTANLIEKVNGLKSELERRRADSPLTPGQMRENVFRNLRDVEECEEEAEILDS